MPRDMVRVQGILMTRDAAQRVEDTGIDVLDDIRRIRNGLSREALLEECLDGFEPSQCAQAQSWTEYVDAVMEATWAERQPDDLWIKVLERAETVVKLYGSKTWPKNTQKAIGDLREACAELREARKVPNRHAHQGNR